MPTHSRNDVWADFELDLETKRLDLKNMDCHDLLCKSRNDKETR